MQEHVSPTITLSLFPASGDVTVLPEWFGSTREPMGTEEPLYRRLGGYDTIAALTDAFFTRLATDPKLGRFLKGYSEDTLHRIRQLTVEFICQGAGGPCYYTGDAMKVAHGGLGITEENWNRFMEIFTAALDTFNVTGKEKSEVLGLVSGLKRDIVGSKAQPGRISPAA